MIGATTSSGPASSRMTETRCTRDKLLIAAGVIGLAAAVLLASADLIGVGYFFKYPTLSAYQISAALNLAHDIPLAIGFGLVAAAFGSSSHRRQRILGIATMSMGIAIALYLMATLAVIIYNSTGIFLSHRQLASEILIATYSLVQVIAAVPIAKAFFRASSDDQTAFSERDRNLSWGVIALAISFTALASSEVLQATLSADASSTYGGYTNGLIIVATSSFVFVLGWILASFAFLRRYIARRDSLLGTSAALLALALLGSSVGSIIYVNAVSSIFSSSLNTAGLIRGAADLVQMGAAICASVAFFVYPTKRPNCDLRM